LKEAGIDKTEFKREVAAMADIAFNDQCTGANPRMPLVHEIEVLYMEAYEGKAVAVKRVS
jgi:acetaldehyde dehydrogenase/alcohol dehydrogenase